MGNDATKNKMTYGLGAAEFGLKGQQTGLDNARGWGKLALDKYGFDKGAINATQLHAMDNQARADAATDNNRSTLQGAAVKFGADWLADWLKKPTSTPTTPTT